jgi:hypothetical protein
VAVIIIADGNRSTRRKPPTCPKSLTNFITQCCIKYTSPWSGFKLTTLLIIGTDCISSCRRIVADTTSLSNSPCFFSGNQKSSTRMMHPFPRMIHPFPHFYIVVIRYWAWSRPSEHSWNIAPSMLSNSQSINQSTVRSLHLDTNSILINIVLRYFL